MMIFQLAWRNIWRKRTRSLIVVGAVAVGIWAAVMMSGFARGMVNGFISNSVENVVSHLQLHHPEFGEDRSIKYTLAPSRLTGLDTMAGIRAWSVRTLVPGMVASGRGARGVEIKGVDPGAEARTTGLDQKITSGTYFEGKRKNEILVGSELAERLNLKTRSKVVLTFQDLNKEITAGAFRVMGIFDTGNNAFDEVSVFVLQNDLNRLLVFSDQAHEVAILLQDPRAVPGFKVRLERRFPDWRVQTYGEIAPELQLYESQIDTISLVYMIIIMMALIFGIINTMLMAVLERISELGMLMAIGMNKLRVFFMIVVETILLSTIAAPFGLLLGYASISTLERTGINLSAWSESLQEFGMQEMIYPEATAEVYWQMAIGIVITAILASFYPALRAIRLRPVEAIRKL